MNKLVRCGDHKLAPSAIVCVHLKDGTATEWLPVPQPPGSECEYDWLCPACVERFPDVPEGDLLVLCIHCVRDLREGRA